MRVRDRLVIAVIAAVLVVGVVWLLLVSPERKEALSLSAQITTEQGVLATAQAALTSDRAAAAGYVDDTRALAQVTTAIPPSVGEASVITTITRLAGTKVDVHSITLNEGGQSAQGPTTLGLNFSFNTTYADLQNFLVALDRLTSTDGTNIAVSGRLFTISGLTFQPSPPNKLQVNVTAQAYSQTPGATAGATGATGTTATAAVTP